MDMVGDEPVPYCSTCLGDALIGLELDKGRIVGVDEWKEEHAEGLTGISPCIAQVQG